MRASLRCVPAAKIGLAGSSCARACGARKCLFDAFKARLSTRMRLPFVGPLLRGKLADTLSFVTETLREAGDSKTACAMANAESFGRRTQLLSGYGACGEDHDCRYGEHYVFYHLDFAPFRLPLPSVFTLQRQFPSNAQQPLKNPSKDLFAANKKIRILRSASSIVGPLMSRSGDRA